MKVLVTGVAGYIGFHVAKRLLADGIRVYGIDNLNGYYDVSLKKDRLVELEKEQGFSFELLDLTDAGGIINIFKTHSFDYVAHLAAQAGVRHSLESPQQYIDSNVTGFLNILEACRCFPVKHLVFASSSSVYGLNTKIPFSIDDNVDRPISLYAVTKKTNELMAYTYSHLFKIPSTGLRFFTVYGPWGRPDMAYFKFAKAIEEGQPIDIYNFGDMQRDFTYIDDVVEGIIRTMYNSPVLQPNMTNCVPSKVYNIGNHQPVSLMRFIEVMEQSLGKVAKKNFLPMQPGDVPITYADVNDLMQDVGFKPSTPIELGIPRFIQWYRDYYLS